jgi:hypothetical protein
MVLSKDRTWASKEFFAVIHGAQVGMIQFRLLQNKGILFVEKALKDSNIY